MKAEKGVLIIVSAPSGCGKSTVLRQLMERRKNLHFSVSATTRAPRQGETDGVDYFFVDRETFEQMIGEEAFLEYAQYVGNYYGTPKKAVEERLEQGYDVYLDIEVQGAMLVKQQRPETLMVFLVPPSIEELERRLTARGTDDAETIRKRLREAEREMGERDKYDFTVVNDDVDRAVDEINDLIERHKQVINGAFAETAEDRNYTTEVLLS